MQPLIGAINRYDWGSTDQIPQILGTPITGQPLAEYWLGAHISGPAQYLDTTLDKAIADNPALVGTTAQLEFDGRLPYLLKLLSASRPLSLQAHPNRYDAAEGYARQNDADIPLEANHRTFKDPWDKPELLVALTEFDALAGFRAPHETYDLFDAIGVSQTLDSLISPLCHRDPSTALAQVFLDCLILDQERSELLTEVVVSAVNHINDDGAVGDFARTAVLLDEHFPGDPSLLAALLLNRHHLQPNEALHIRPGQMHAYLHGTGVEVMGNSDNVLRGGLTNKHIDPSALVHVVDFTPSTDSRLTPTCESPGLWHYDAQEDAFALWRMELQSSRAIEAPAECSGRILLVTRGEIGVSPGLGGLELRQGEACFIAAYETVTISGEGQAFLVGTGMDACR